MIQSVYPELIFEVILHATGAYTAQCLNADMQVGGSSLHELHDNLSAAIDHHYQGRSCPDASKVHLLMFRD